MTAIQSLTPTPKLRWYQYSLRSLMIFVTLFACLCSWFAVKMQQAKRQKEAVEKLRGRGYAIEYDYEHVSPVPEWVVKLLGKDFLFDVYSVGEMISLPMMKFHVPALTDADMAVFDELPRLRTLRFCNNFGNPAKFTDQGLAHLEMLKGLESLDLSGTQLTDAGLKHLKGLTKLERLNLNYTDVTEAGISDLQNAIPALEIGHMKTGIAANPFEWPEEECIRIITKIEIP
jgi:hypothetical protein